MVHRDHINLSTSLFYSLFLLPASLPIISTIGNYAYIPFLFGSLLPDMDINFYDRSHRLRSPAHNLGYALISCLLFGGIAVALYIYYPPAAKGLNSYTLNGIVSNFGLYESFVAGFLISCGWVAHLIGDFIQGGMKFFSKRIGIKKFTWDTYYGTSTSLFNLMHIGSYIGWFLLFAAPCLMFLNWTLAPRLIHAIPVALYLTCSAASGCDKAIAALLSFCAILVGTILFTPLPL